MLQYARGRLPRLLERAGAAMPRLELELSPLAAVSDPLVAPPRSPPQRSIHSYPTFLLPRGNSGTVHDMLISRNDCIGHRFNHSLCSCSFKASFSTDATASNGPTDSVKDLHGKIFQAIEAKSVPPNAWIWSLIESCSNEADITLLFQMLEKFRRFRLSSLRISTNFNSHLCQRVAEACARSNAFDYGLKTLRKHNTFGLTPSVASAHYLLRHAKNDCKLMREIVKVMEENDLPLQPVTADLVFSICYNANRWDLICIYSEKFINAGVKLHRNTFDTWMEFAANRGDVSSLWKIEELCLKSTKQRSVSNAFSCAKGFLLGGKPESAAAVIHAIDQSLPDHKKADLEKEFQKFINDWPSKVVKRTKGGKQSLAHSLKKDIPTMMEHLTRLGLQYMISMDKLNQELV